MNKDLFQGKWHEIKGKIKEKWGKLTDDDLTEISGKKEAFLGKLQTHYGYAKDKAEKELCDFEQSCGCDKSEKSGSCKPH
ncbi:MAG: CsbD family protein [Parachlamydiaceae bacterium]